MKGPILAMALAAPICAGLGYAIARRWSRDERADLLIVNDEKNKQIDLFASELQTKLSCIKFMNIEINNKTEQIAKLEAEQKDSIERNVALAQENQIEIDRLAIQLRDKQVRVSQLQLELDKKAEHIVRLADEARRHELAASEARVHTQCTADKPSHNKCPCCLATEILVAPFTKMCLARIRLLINPSNPGCTKRTCDLSHDLSSNSARLYGLIGSATKSIDVCMYDLHNTQICNFLIDLCETNIRRRRNSSFKIRILTDGKKYAQNMAMVQRQSSETTSNGGKPNAAPRLGLKRLLDYSATRPSNIVWRCYNYGDERGTMHNKFAIVDAKYLTTGSANWSHGLISNQETFEVTQAPKRVRMYQLIFNQLFGPNTL